MAFAVSTMAQHKGMKTYSNEKYQYAVNIPESFGGMGESPAGDGQTFVSLDGENHIQVYGGYNAQTLFGTTFDEEYDAELKKLNDRHVELLDQGTMDDPDGEFDDAFVLVYLEDGLYHYRRTVWWRDRFATVEIVFYKEDKADFDNLLIDRILYSLGPDDDSVLTESEKVLGWHDSDAEVNVYKSDGKPTIGDFFLSFAASYQTPIMMMALEKLNDPSFNDEDIHEWVLDKKNGYLKLVMVSNKSYWVEACYWNCDNGHKLFVVNLNAPSQVLLPFDYDPVTNLLTPVHDTFQMLKNHTDLVAQLPRQGKDIILRPRDNFDKVSGYLKWRGNGFELVK